MFQYHFPILMLSLNNKRNLSFTPLLNLFFRSYFWDHHQKTNNMELTTNKPVNLLTQPETPTYSNTHIRIFNYEIDRIETNMFVPVVIVIGKNNQVDMLRVLGKNQLIKTEQQLFHIFEASPKLKQTFQVFWISMQEVAIYCPERLEIKFVDTFSGEAYYYDLHHPVMTQTDTNLFHHISGTWFSKIHEDGHKLIFEFNEKDAMQSYISDHPYLFIEADQSESFQIYRWSLRNIGPQRFVFKQKIENDDVIDLFKINHSFIIHPQFIDVFGQPFFFFLENKKIYYSHAEYPQYKKLLADNFEIDKREFLASKTLAYSDVKMLDSQNAEALIIIGKHLFWTSKCYFDGEIPILSTKSIDDKFTQPGCVHVGDILKPLGVHVQIQWEKCKILDGCLEYDFSSDFKVTKFQTTQHLTPFGMAKFIGNQIFHMYETDETIAS